jgi:GNAT superfamily N-acetyltransferase
MPPILPTFARFNGSFGLPLSDLIGIYEASIPASERKPAEAIRDMACRSDYRLVVATQDQTLLGFAAVFAPPDENFALLEYLAVDERFRGGGIGAGLFRAAVRTLEDDARAGPLLIEVEALEGDPAERARQERRRAFYRRLGCRRVAGLDYLLPLRAAAAPPPPVMHLFARVAANVPLSRADLERALGVIYPRVYGQHADDPRIAAMLAAVGDPVGLE